MNVIEQYWPLMVLVVWFGYKWWAAKQVASQLPTLRQNGAVFVDVRSVAEFASGNGMLMLPGALPDANSATERTSTNTAPFCRNAGN